VRILLIGAGGVGDAIVKISADRNFFEKLIVSDYDIQRAEKSVEWVNQHSPEAADKFQTAQIDASDSDQVAALAKEVGATHIMNAVEPKFARASLMVH